MLIDAGQLFPGKGRSLLLDVRQQGGGLSQTVQFPGTGGAIEHPGQQPLQVIHPVQQPPQFLQGNLVAQQFPNGVLPPGNGSHPHQGLFQGLAQKPLAHAGFGFIQHPQQASPLLSGTHSLSDFQIPPGSEVNVHVFVLSVQGDPAEPLGPVFLGALDVLHQPRQSLFQQGAFRDSQFIAGLHPKLAANQRPRLFQQAAFLFQ